MFRAIVQKQILLVTVNRKKQAFREFHARRSPPEVDAILFTAVEVFQSLFETTIMYLVRTQIGLG
jgi:hypothetical protein